MFCTKYCRRKLSEVIIGLWNGFKLRHMAGKMNSHHLQDMNCGGHFYGGECDERRNLYTLCPCNEGESNDEEHNKFKIHLLHMPLKLLILPTTLQITKNHPKTCTNVEHSEYMCRIAYDMHIIVCSWFKQL